MRIVQVSTLYPPELHSGGTLACHQLALALKERGHEVSVFAGSSVHGEPALLEKDWVYEGIRVRAINVATGYGHVPQNYRNLSAAERFERFLQTRRPDVVHFHSIQALGADLLPVARRYASCVAVTMHDAWFACAQQFLTTPPPQLRNCPLSVDPSTCDCINDFDFTQRRTYLDAALEHVDVVIAVSPFLKSVLEQSKVAPGKIVVVENGIAPASPLPSTGRREEHVRFGYLGGAHPWKGFGTLASAVSLVERDFILELHGVDKGEWERAAQPDTRVLCLPRFTPADLPRIMRRLDVVLLPSIVYESFSLVTREALQYGRPVIASRCGGPESILRDGSNGLLFDRGDAAGLARAMQTFVDDGELLANAKQKATQTPVMTVSEQASEIERVYGSASRSRPSAPPAERLPRSIFFVAGMDGAPFRYRVANLVETARSLGLKASARFYRDEEVLALAGEHDVVVLNRVPWDPYIARVVERARAAGAVVVFAVDDLIFDPKADIPALSTLPRDIVERYWEGVRLFRATLDRSDAFLGSTEALADAASGTGRKAFVVPNTMSRELIELSNIVYQHRSKRAASGRVRIGYFSGTDSHDRDLASITSALRLTLERNPTVQLVFGGHLGLPAELKGHEDRIAWLPFVPWRKLPGLLSTIDINLAPLETGYAFNDAKSELKWFEAAAVGIPTIASATRPFKTAIRHGVDGYVAETPAQWSELIQALVDDPALRARIGEAAHSAAIERNGPDAGIAALAKALGQIENLRTTPPRLLPRPSPEELNAIRRSGIVIGKAAMEPNDLVAGPSQPFGTQPTPRLGDGVTALQPLFLPDGLLQRVDVMVATYARVYHHDLVLQLIDLGTGSKLAEQRLPAEHACDNAWLAFELGGIPTDEGTQYALAISAPGAREGISLYCRPAGWPAGAGTCGALRGVDLAYRTWMRSHTDGDDAQAPDRSEGALALDDIERRLHVAEERLADALKPRLTTSERIRKTTAWRSARKIVAVLRASNAVGPSLPYTALRKIIRATRPAADDADVELLMQRMQASRAYRTARRFYRSITRRP